MNRRSFLRGVGGAALGLPLLHAMGPRRGRAAGAGGFPRRFIAFFSSQGVIRSQWAPSGTGPAFELSPILAPLADHKADLLVLSGIDMDVAYLPGGNAHQKGMGATLTGRGLLTSGPNASYASGISVDQRMAQALPAETRFRSLELGVNVPRTITPEMRMSYTGPGQPLPPEDDPFALFTRLFGDGADPEAAARRRAQRETVLAAVKASYQRLEARVGAEDRQRLEAHAEAVRQVERRLVDLDAASCTPTAPDASFDPHVNENFPRVGQLQMDLIALALACDLTRVVTLQWSRAGSAMPFTWLGIPESHHSLAHAGDSDAAARQKLVAIETWYADQLAYLIAKLKEMPEGDGSVFDNTTILWFSDISKGNDHSRKAMPHILAGSCGGALRTGRHVQYSGKQHNDLLVSLLNAMEVPDTTFGDPDYCSGPLPDLT
ncbi:MAG TPA: DUF1552 domain-containing protein [Kofleriaceae bacterium]|nr:DUF1552 domain-containing protein [Kofleriaceae bacterium]